MAKPFDLPDYVASLQLHPTPAPQAHESAYVAGASLVSFAAGLSRQSREDVLNSTLLMQQAASKKFHRISEREQWFDFYCHGLGQLGWVMANSTLDQYSSTREAFNFDEIVLDIIDAETDGQPYRPLVKRTFDALREHPRALELFEASASSGVHSNFQILPCVQTADQGVAMLMNCMQLNRNEVRRRFLFMHFRSHAMKLFNSSQVALLDESIYSRAREAVIEKLGHNSQQFIKELVL